MLWLIITPFVIFAYTFIRRILYQYAYRTYEIERSFLEGNINLKKIGETDMNDFDKLRRIRIFSKVNFESEVITVILAPIATIVMAIYRHHVLTVVWFLATWFFLETLRVEYLKGKIIRNVDMTYFQQCADKVKEIMKEMKSIE